MTDRTFGFVALLYFNSNIPNRHEMPVRDSINAPDALSAIKVLAEGKSTLGSIYAAVVYDGNKPAFGYASGEARADMQSRERREALVNRFEFGFGMDITRAQFGNLRPRIGRQDEDKWVHHLELNNDGQWLPLEEIVEKH